MRKGEHRWLLALIAFALCGIVVLSDAGRFEPTSPSSRPSSMRVSLGPTLPSFSAQAPKKPSTSRPESKSTSPAKQARTTSWVESVRRCIVKRESGGNYRIRSRTTDTDGRYAYGAYQFQTPTFRAVTGLPGPASAYSKAVQDAAFYKLFDNGRGRSHWYLKGGPNCW